MYGKIVNGKLELAPNDLIKEDGTVIFDYYNNKYNCLADGYKEVINEKPIFNVDTQTVKFKGYNEANTKIYFIYEVISLENQVLRNDNPEVKSLKTEIDALIQENNKLKEDISAKDKNIGDLTYDLEHAGTTLLEKDNDIHELNNNLDDAFKLINEKEESIEDLNSKLAEANSTIEEKDMAIKVLNFDLDEKNNAISIFTDENSKLEGTIEDLNNQLAETISSKDNSIKELNEKLDECDIEKEKARLTKDLGKKQGELKGLEGKLSNEKFVARAPEAVVNAEREKAAKSRDLIAQLEQSEQAMRKL